MTPEREVEREDPAAEADWLQELREDLLHATWTTQPAVVRRPWLDRWFGTGSDATRD